MYIIHFNEASIPYSELQFLGWPNIVAHSPAGLICIWISDTGSKKRSDHYHNNRLLSVTSELGVLVCGRKADLSG